MEQNLSWEVVKEFYQEQFGIDGWVVEMYAVLDVLILCASGAGNDSISKFTDIPVKDVTKIIRDTFDFDGWETDLPVNPYRLYCEIEKEFEDHHHKDVRFISEMQSGIRSMQGMINREFIIGKSCLICRTLQEIEERITNEWI